MKFALSLALLAATAMASDCVEESKVRFFANGQQINSEVVGAEKCDGFGGDRAATPIYKISVYVNFNIETYVNLDEIDQSYSANAPAALQDWLGTVKLVLVRKPQMTKLSRGANPLVMFSRDKKAFFVSEEVLEKQIPLKAVWEMLYQGHYMRTTFGGKWVPDAWALKVFMGELLDKHAR